MKRNLGLALIAIFVIGLDVFAANQFGETQ